MHKQNMKAMGLKTKQVLPSPTSYNTTINYLTLWTKGQGHSNFIFMSSLTSTFNSNSKYESNGAEV